MDHDGLVGPKRPLIDPFLGPNMKSQGPITRPGSQKGPKMVPK